MALNFLEQLYIFNSFSNLFGSSLMVLHSQSHIFSMLCKISVQLGQHGSRLSISDQFYYAIEMTHALVLILLSKRKTHRMV
jgi:hypothetical protein